MTPANEDSERSRTERFGDWYERHGLGIVSTTGTAITSVMGVLAGLLLFTKLEGDAWAQVLAWGCLALLFFLVVLLVTEHHFRVRRVAHAVRKAIPQLESAQRSVHAMPGLHLFTHSVRDAYWELVSSQDGTPEQLDRTITELRAALRHAAHTFTAVTGRECRACIKEMVERPAAGTPIENLRVKTLIRHSHEDQHEGRDSEAPVTASSAFHRLVTRVDEDESYFLVQDWHKAPDSLRSFSRENYPMKPDYRSTLVLPIQKRRGPRGRPYLIAFLCLDSLEPNAFQKEQHFDLGASMADSLFPLVNELQERVGEQPTRDGAAAG